MINKKVIKSNSVVFAPPCTGKTWYIQNSSKNNLIYKEFPFGILERILNSDELHPGLPLNYLDFLSSPTSISKNIFEFILQITQSNVVYFYPICYAFIYEYLKRNFDCILIIPEQSEEMRLEMVSRLQKRGFTFEDAEKRIGPLNNRTSDEELIEKLTRGEKNLEKNLTILYMHPGEYLSDLLN